MITLEQERLRQKHPGDTNQSKEKQDNLDHLLAAPESRVLVGLVRVRGVVGGGKEHVHEGVQKRRGVEGIGLIPVGEPLVHNEEAKVTEDRQHKEHLGNKLEKEVIGLLAVNSIESGKRDTQQHLSDTNQHRHLHLQRVIVVQLVNSALPSGIGTEGVTVGVIVAGVEVHHVRRLRVLSDVPVLARPKEHRNRKALVVQKPIVNRKDGHENNNIPTVEKCLDHFVQTAVDKFILVIDEEGDKEKHNTTVTDVTEHHTEQERESNNGENCGVNFLVATNTISINNLLMSPSVLVGPKVGRGGFLGVQNGLEHDGKGRATAVGGTVGSHAHNLQLVGSAPTLSNQGLSSQVVLKQVHGVVDALLLQNTTPPGVILPSDTSKELLRTLGVLGTDNIQIVLLLHQLVDFIALLLIGSGAVEGVGTEGFAQLEEERGKRKED